MTDEIDRRMIEIRLFVRKELVRDVDEDILALTLGNEAARKAKDLLAKQEEEA